VGHYLPSEQLSVLDVGGGNGAIELALSAESRFRTTSVEMLWNDTARSLSVRAGRKFQRVVADAARLPFRAGQFDVILCLETLEHVEDAATTGAEIARVTRSRGLLLVTTPPRWRYAFAGDPHFGIRGLALLPAGMQRYVAGRHGFVKAHHYVAKLYGSVREVARAFRGFGVQDVLSRSRAPRRWFWDALILRKR
jgi:2-polyprenyl-3-methyl-5-hydroxy-6-metoxy-1,4-benzoquinol methylase